jgi:hypothetical protein
MFRANTGENPENEPGVGESIRGESGLTPIEEARMIGRAVRERWYGDQRWPVDATRKEIEAIKEQRELTLREEAVLATFEGLRNPKSAHVHARTAVAMDDINMKQEEADNPTPKNPQQTNVEINLSLDGRRARALQILDAISDRERIGGDGSDSDGHGRPNDANGSSNGFPHS